MLVYVHLKCSKCETVKRILSCRLDVDRTVSQSVSQSLSNSVNQSISQSVTQSINLSVSPVIYFHEPRKQRTSRQSILLPKLRMLTRN